MSQEKTTQSFLRNKKIVTPIFYEPPFFLLTGFCLNALSLPKKITLRSPLVEVILQHQSFLGYNKKSSGEEDFHHYVEIRLRSEWFL